MQRPLWAHNLRDLKPIGTAGSDPAGVGVGVGATTNERNMIGFVKRL